MTLCEIWDSHSSTDEDKRSLRCASV